MSATVSTGSEYTVTTPPDGVAAGIVAGIRSDCAQILSPRSSRGLGMDSLNAFFFAFTSVLVQPYPSFFQR